MGIYEGVGERLFSISYSRNFSPADRAPRDGQRRRVGGRQQSVRGRYRPEIILEGPL